MATDTLTAAAEDLYALVPEEFTAARNARVKEAKADDRELGDRIAELRKPSPAAWIVNQLVREHPDAIDELLDLGTDLRDAQAAGDGKALTNIGSERRKLVSALLKQATEIADAADRSPSRAVLDEVEQTLIAATVDEAAGEALRTGRLVRSLQAVGFEDVDLDGAVAGEASAGRPVKRRSARPARREKEAAADEVRPPHAAPSATTPPAPNATGPSVKVPRPTCARRANARSRRNARSPRPRTCCTPPSGMPTNCATNGTSSRRG